MRWTAANSGQRTPQPSSRVWRIALMFVFLLVCAWPRTARAQEDILAQFRDAPVVSVLTFGPGDAAFYKFGHNAIRVQDKKRRTDLVYNFGTFSFESKTLILDFLTGKFRYWLSAKSMRSTLAVYTAENRSVVEQTLNLSPWTANEINDALIENAKPENAEYLYDYYRDNCSTRVRDVIDRAMKGDIQRRFDKPASMTFREHTLRLVADDFWLYFGLDIAMSSVVDQQETRYSEMFLPEKVEDGLGGVIFSGVHGTSPLVSSTKVWHEPRNRTRLRSKPPEWTANFFKVGAAVGVLFAFMGWESYRRRQRWAEIAFPLLLGLLGLATGVLGTLFLGLWLFTDHEVAFHNENLLQCAPFGLGYAFLAYGALRGRYPALRFMHRLSAATLAAATLGLCLKALPMFEQQNQRIIALFLPIWMGVFLGCYWMHQKGLRLARIQEGTAEADPGEASAPSEEEDSERETKKDKKLEESEEDQKEDEGDEHPSSLPPQPAPA